MNFTKIMFAIAISASIFACKDSANEPETATKETATADVTANSGKVETATFEIKGMTCAAGCAKSLETDLSKLDGVIEATVDYDKKTATVKFDTAKQTPEAIVEAVEDSGDGRTYSVANLQSSGDQAMVIDPEKIKKKQAKKAKKDAAKKQASAETSEPAAAKPACCAAKKACHGEEKAGTL